MHYTLEIQRDACGAVSALIVSEPGTRNVWGVDHPEDISLALDVARDMAGADPFDASLPADEWIIRAITGEESI
jgi:hypothetical protein